VAIHITFGFIFRTFGSLFIFSIFLYLDFLRVGSHNYLLNNYIDPASYYFTVEGNLDKEWIHEMTGMSNSGFDNKNFLIKLDSEYIN
jgi:hypothetical protein